MFIVGIVLSVMMAIFMGDRSPIAGLILAGFVFMLCLTGWAGLFLGITITIIGFVCMNDK